MDDEKSEQLPLKDAAGHLLDECRMVLPGIQALFGFQLIAVFNQRFAHDLSSTNQKIHLLATVLVAIAIAIVMAPAAIHRQVEPRRVSQRFIDVSSRLLLFSMLPLALSISLESYIVSSLVLHETTYALAVAAIVLAWFVVMWIVLPLTSRTRTRP